MTEDATIHFGGCDIFRGEEGVAFPEVALNFAANNGEFPRRFVSGYSIARTWPLQVGGYRELRHGQDPEVEWGHLEPFCPVELGGHILNWVFGGPRSKRP